ncbi:high affinity copper uptake protein 1 [Stomoxys calcitrans]|uniref:high affinity copper uptake protein 1 n=1 Tax=Stomoxys calcitrans TaxID=35570 RepID=UPI0027E25274|nr:high affinity copper uptake protein 1 [Stomoxys calcitrans]
MDHDHDHGSGGGGDGKVSCPMIMVFHAGHCERILWDGWVASTVVEFVFSALAIFLVAFIYEALKFVREYFLRQTVRKEAERVALELQAKRSSPPCHAPSTTAMMPIQEKTYMQRIFSEAHLIQTFCNLLQIVISYLLMLVFMTFNYWLCLAVVLGLGIGYFVFGWIKQDVYESECCQ